MTTTTTATQERGSGAESGLAARLEGLRRLVDLGSGRIDPGLLADAAALLERAEQRLGLSGEHTVVTLAGGTGSGKSSLFNAICGLKLSPVGMRRPMTSKAHACVWGLDGAGPLLDWLGVDKRYRYARAGSLETGGSGASSGSLQGLVLIDLPDHDSIAEMHRAEVDRFVSVADLLVWVVDPQKYADAALHRDYIVPYARHADVTVIVLNQIDRLQPEEVGECVSDLRRLLEAEGLADPRIVTTSAVAEGGIADLRDVLVETIAARRARVERLMVDVDRLVERFAGYATAAEAMESAYELRAEDYVGWPISRLAARLRSDPLRKMRLTELREELRGAFTGPVGAQQGDVDTALHGVTDEVTAGLPEDWARAVRAASRSHAADLPEALGDSLKDVLPEFNQVPRWWWLIKTWQYFLLLVSVVSLVWIALLVACGVAGVWDDPPALIGEAGLIPYVAVLLGCVLGMGALTASACRNVVALSSARHGERMEEQMRARIAEVAEERVLYPVADELRAYARFRDEANALLHRSS